MGKTTATTASEIALRYAAIAAHPDAEIRRVREAVDDLAREPAARPPSSAWCRSGSGWCWAARRRLELVAPARPDAPGSPRSDGARRRGPSCWCEPWRAEPDACRSRAGSRSRPRSPRCTCRPTCRAWQIQGGLVTKGTRRLRVQPLRHLRQEQGVLPGRRRPGRRSGRPAPPARARTRRSPCWSATGTTTSAWTRSSARRPTRPAPPSCWTPATTPRPGSPGRRSASTRSTRPSTATTPRSRSAGNHDNGTFVSQLPGEARLDAPRRRARRSRSRACGSPASTTRAPAASATGVTRRASPSPRSGPPIADDVCELDEQGERIATLLVHDANLGGTALARGCTDLVLAGHLHVQKGPTRVVGENGKVGLHLHERHDRRGGVRHRDREQAAPRRPSSPSSPTATAGRSGSSR